MCILKEVLGFGEGENSNLEKEAEEDLEEEEGTFHPPLPNHHTLYYTYLGYPTCHFTYKKCLYNYKRKN